MSKIIDELEKGNLSLQEVGERCINENLSFGQAQQFIYSVNRNRRFELFLILYDTILKNSDVETLFYTFKEAYCASNNIFIQIQNSLIDFDIKLFLTDIQKQISDFTKLMSSDELIYYNGWFFFNLVEKNMFHYQLVFKKSYTRFTIH